MADYKQRLGDLLVEKNIVSEYDIQRALIHQEQYGGKIGQALVALNILSEDKLLAALRYHFGLPVVDLGRTEIPPHIIRFISAEMAERYTAVPIKIKETGKGKTLLVVMSNPMDINAIEELQFAAGYKISPVLAKESDIQAALKKYYRLKGRSDSAVKVSVGEGSDVDEMTIIQGGEEFKIGGEKKKEGKPAGEGSSDMDYEQIMKEKRLWRALIKLLVDKGVITMNELEEMLSRE
jgi:type IV pilus assembly protein PilB